MLKSQGDKMSLPVAYDQVRTILNVWIKRRGEAVHKAQIDGTKPDIVKRDELVKCLRFFSELATATDKALEAV